MRYPMSEEAAESVYDILVEHCGAHDNELDRYSFVYNQTKDFCTEYRFGGNLGMGGKFRRNMGKWYVDCYPEDTTPEREEIMAEANTHLYGQLIAEMNRNR